MNRLENLPTFLSHQIQPGQLASGELHYAATHVSRRRELYRTRAVRDGCEAQELELLFFPESRRAGIAAGGQTWWLDAGSAGEALRRWSEGEGRCTPARALPRSVDL